MNEKFKTTNLINLDVFSTSLDLVDNKKLLNEIELHNSNGEQGFLGYKSGGSDIYISEDIEFPKFSPECNRLSLEIESAVTTLLGKKMKITEIWALELSRGQSVSVHSHKSNTHMHPNEYYSVAYYPVSPAGSSKLIFNVSWCNTMENLIGITPKEGMLVIFNSYIKHLTNRHDSDEKRVVVSANLCPEIPNITPVPDWSVYG